MTWLLSAGLRSRRVGKGAASRRAHHLSQGAGSNGGHAIGRASRDRRLCPPYDLTHHTIISAFPVLSAPDAPPPARRPRAACPPPLSARGRGRRRRGAFPSARF